MSAHVIFKYRELDYAKQVYENGFQSKHIPTELELLALYAREKLDISPSEIKDFLYRFCEEKIPVFNRVAWFRTINKAVKYARDRKNSLVQIEAVEVTKGEVEYILSLNISHDYKKLMFAFLVQLRLNKMVSEFKKGKKCSGTCFGGRIRIYNAIKKMANVPTSIDINADFIRDMHQAGLIQIYYNGLIMHIWLNECKPAGEVAIRVEDFENVGYYLDYYCGQNNVKLCKRCNRPFKGNRKNRTFCSECKDYHPPLEKKEIVCVEADQPLWSYHL